jgi:hypothetical protein
MLTTLLTPLVTLLTGLGTLLTTLICAVQHKHRGFTSQLNSKLFLPHSSILIFPLFTEKQSSGFVE